MKTTRTDVLIVGSGFGAAAPALRLAQAGLQVTLVEKGPAINPFNDFRQTQDPRYLLTYLKTISGEQVSFNYVEGEGGGSGFYEHLSFRAPTMVFQQQDQQGYLLWVPEVDRQILDPYYDLGEQMLRVNQVAAEEVPKTGLVFAQLMKRLGYSADRAPYATVDCRQCGRCLTGCIYGAKQSLLLNYLPQAVDAGARIITDTEAIRIKTLRGYQRKVGQMPMSNRPYRYEVLCRSNGEDGEKQVFVTKLLILAGGTIGTAQLLLRSQKHLPNLSDQVGQTITFNSSVKIGAILPDWCADGDMFTGRSHPGIVSFEFMDSHRLMVSAAKALPLQIFSIARISQEMAHKTGWWGEDHVALLQKLRRRIIFLVALGQMPPVIRMTSSRKGKFKLTIADDQAIIAFEQLARPLLESIITKNGGEVLRLDFMSHKGIPHEGVHLTNSHPLGSCRMAVSKERGVVDAYGQVFDYPDMYITDGSAIPGSLIVNPSLTILANAERITANIMTHNGI